MTSRTINALFLRKIKFMNMQTAYLAGGCFWCLEAPFRTLQGVVDVISGYMGGHLANPDYKAVCSRHRSCGSDCRAI